MSVPPDRVREASGLMDEQGVSHFNWRLTPSSLTGIVNLPIPPNGVLPVIFVPGIMGSNLRASTGTAPVWRLDKGLFGQPLPLVRRWRGTTAGERQAVLHPDRVRVDNRGGVPERTVGSVSRTQQYADRGWGEVAETSYHDFLLWLEERLNGQSFNPARWDDFYYIAASAAPRPGERPPEPTLQPGIGMRMRNFSPHAHTESPPGARVPQVAQITSDDLLTRAKFRMPVHAFGYNWLASNNVAAEALKDRINQVMAQYNRNGSHCDQVVLVTHSMGGLVARRCAMLAGMGEKVAGIVHGVMPAIGAAVAYRRCKVGMQDEDWMAGMVIGNDGQRVTAVFAQTPGALQLLPSSQYGNAWLKIRDANGTVHEAQPTADPYADIYLRRDRWWSLLREEWLSPEGGAPINWGDYVKNISQARSFHQVIKDKYHPNTYVYYGADNEQPSFETVEWTIQNPHHYASAFKNRPSTEQVSRMGFGDVLDSGGASSLVIEQLTDEQRRTPYRQAAIQWRLDCGLQDGGGDGTVPTSSGRAPIQHGGGAIRQQFRLAGFEHEASYRNVLAQQATLHSLMKIAGAAKVRV